MKVASGPSRKATTAAISSGVPNHEATTPITLTMLSKTDQEGTPPSYVLTPASAHGTPTGSNDGVVPITVLFPPELATDAGLLPVRGQPLRAGGTLTQELIDSNEVVYLHDGSDRLSDLPAPQPPQESGDVLHPLVETWRCRTA